MNIQVYLLEKCCKKVMNEEKLLLFFIKSFLNIKLWKQTIQMRNNVNDEKMQRTHHNRKKDKNS